MTEKLLEIPVEKLMPDPSQPRKTFNPDAIYRLAVSIAESRRPATAPGYLG